MDRFLHLPFWVGGLPGPRLRNFSLEEERVL